MLLLVRHGRTAANAEGRLVGRSDVGLDEVGRRQAAATAALVGQVDRVVSSPLERARQTAAEFGLPVEIDERWIELDYGEWDGRRVSEVEPLEWMRWQGDLDFAPPGGESLRSVGRRVREACEELAALAVDQRIVVVTHVSSLKAAIAWALGVGDETSWRCFVAPGSVSRIRITDTGPTLVSFNESAHLAGIAPLAHW
ncbi:MAG TPA: histidine phosphatase family protein [Acidimicrobiales bacterium]